MTHTRIPEGALLNKLKASEKHFGLDKLSDELLIKIAQHAVPRERNLFDRYIAIAVIVGHRLPIPVVTSSRRESGSEAKG